MSKAKNIVVIGGGIAGLCSALWFGSRGHNVIVLERDDAPLPTTVDEAWEAWDRPGAPQVRQPHVVLGRLTSLLRNQHPDVYQGFLDAGCRESTFADLITPETVDYVPEPDDHELTSIRIRRVTLEWVLRKAVLAHSRVEFRSGSKVAGLVAQPGPIPHVTGVRMEDGATISGDLVVAAAGKRCQIDRWFTDIGAAPMPEEGGESGVVYISRFYRLPKGREFNRNAPTIITHGYLRGGVFEADQRTFSVSVTLPKEDTELRKLLFKAGNLECALRELPQYSSIADAISEPISPVSAMAGVTNSWRSLIVDGKPLVTGLVPVGDTLMTTNPAYGRGMSIAAWSVDILARALDEHADDPMALARAYAAEASRDIKPWYEVSRAADDMNRRAAEAVLAGDGMPVRENSQFGRMFTLAKYDAVVQRAFMRSTFLLSAPKAMLEDPDVMRRLADLYARFPDVQDTASDTAKERDRLIAMLTDGVEPAAVNEGKAGTMARNAAA